MSENTNRQHQKDEVHMGGRGKRSAWNMLYGIHEMMWRRVDSNLPTYLPTHLPTYLSNLLTFDEVGVFDVTTCTYTMIIGGDMIMIEEDMIRQDQS